MCDISTKILIWNSYLLEVQLHDYLPTINDQINLTIMELNKNNLSFEDKSTLREYISNKIKKAN